MTAEKIKQYLSETFPYLRLEFAGVGNPASEPFPYPEITGDLTVQETETMLTQILGIKVQILRKTGQMWVETGRTKDWTLRRQNEHGRELSAAAHP